MWTMLLLLGLATQNNAVEHNNVNFYVSPLGNDGWSGKLPEPKDNDGPFATVKRAQEAVRALLKTQKEPQPVGVLLRGGTYYIDKTLEFGPEDSGAEDGPVVYAAAPGEKVIISGGRQLSSEAFRPVDNPEVLERLPEESRGAYSGKIAEYPCLFAMGLVTAKFFDKLT